MMSGFTVKRMLNMLGTAGLEPLTAEEILETGKEYTDEQLRNLLSGHLCRCTGYENILRAVKKTMYRRLGKEL